MCVDVNPTTIHPSVAISRMMFIYLMITVIGFNAVESTIDSCRGGWSAFGDYCYFENIVAGNYEAARDYCIDHDSTLTSIHSQEEQDFLTGLATGPYIWIGLNDMASENTFTWLDATPLDFTQFGANQPDNGEGNGEDCVAMTQDVWYDLDCRINGNALCKRRRPECEDYYDQSTLQILKESTQVCLTQEIRNGTYSPSSTKSTLVLSHDNLFYTNIRYIRKISIDTNLLNSTDIISEYDSFSSYVSDQALQIGDPVSFNISIYKTLPGNYATTMTTIPVSIGHIYDGTSFWLSKDGDTFSIPINPPVEIEAGMIYVHIAIIDSGSIPSYRWPSGIGSSAGGSSLHLMACLKEPSCDSVAQAWAPLNTLEYAILRCPFPSDGIYRAYQYACLAGTPIDIDECADNTDDCHTDATCRNSVGSYTCQCNEGYTGDGRTCSDVNECTNSLDDCHADATCKNSIGRYTCQCNKGYAGDGMTCLDVNECATNDYECHPDATCINFVGYYRCKCKDGFDGDGSSCSVNLDLESLAKISVTEDNVEDVVANLTQVINTVITIDDAIGNEDLEYISVILDGIVEADTPSENLTRSVVAIVDNVITTYDDGTFNEDHPSRIQQDSDASPDEVSPFPNQIQRALESQISTLQMDQEGSNDTVIEGDNVVIHAVKIHRESLTASNLVFESNPMGDDGKFDGMSTRVQVGKVSERGIPSEAAISLPSDAFVSYAEGNRSTVAVSFLVYQNAKLFPSQRLINDSMKARRFRVAVASRIITANVEGSADIAHLPDASQVESIFSLFTEKDDQNARVDNPICVFWDINANDGIGDWSNEGCRLNRTLPDGTVVCHCNHLTSFAVIVDIYGQSAMVLDVISKVGCGISITCLLITIATYLSNRKLHEKQPQRIMIHFCFSLLFLYIVFIAGIEQTKPRWGCMVVSVLIHYFTLTSILWMGVEATNMYILFVKVVGVYIPRFMLKAGLVAWGLPVVIIAIAMSVDYTQYINSHHCFLQIGYTFYFGQLLFMGLVILYNTVVFVLIMQSLLFGRAASSKRHSSKKAETLKRAKTAIPITVLLGLTWMFGLLSLIHEQASFTFQIMFCVFNSLQGFLVFYMFCVRQEKVVNIWKEWFRCGKERRGSALTSLTPATASSPIDKTAPSELSQFRCTYDPIPPSEKQPSRDDEDVVEVVQEKKILISWWTRTSTRVKRHDMVQN